MVFLSVSQDWKMLMPKDNFLTEITKHWAIIVFLVGMAVTWGRFESRINTMETKLTALEIKQEKSADVLSELQGDLREIKTSLKFIEQRLK